MSYAVIIPSYNRPEMLQRALASVFAQTLAPTQICLTIDEPQDSGKYAFLRDYDASVLDAVFSGGGCGGAKARNLGLDRVKDVDYVFFLDDDDEWLPEKSEKQIALLESRSDAVAVTCDCYRCYGEKRSLLARDEGKINRYVKLWNYTGGFSCFGLKWFGAIRNLRLRDELASAQDFEYYIRIADEGLIALCGEPLVLFNMHPGVRISGDRVKKRESFKAILEMEPHRFGWRDRLFNEAKGDILCASSIEQLSGALAMYMQGSAKLLLSFQLFSVSSDLWLNSSRRILARLIK